MTPALLPSAPRAIISPWEAPCDPRPLWRFDGQPAKPSLAARRWDSPRRTYFGIAQSKTKAQPKGKLLTPAEVHARSRAILLRAEAERDRIAEVEAAIGIHF